MTTPPVPSRAADLAAWLRDRFIPCWAARVLVPGLAGYAEEFRWHDGAPFEAGDHTTMVTGRLVYAFSLAYRFDRAPQTLAAAEHGLRFLLGTCCLSPGRFAHRVGRDGAVIDPHADLYDIAFVLLALGGYSAATGRADVLAAAHAIADRLDGELADPLGGYREPAGTGRSRLQYPQMHLFEAFQMLAAADPSGGWDARAERILDLVSRLADEDGALDEEFGPRWDVLEPQWRRREIGHHFEWAWLLFVHATATGSARAADIAWRLFDFARVRAGLATAGPDRPIPNAIDLSGRPVSDARPLWPTMELAKASLAAAVIGDRPDYAVLSRKAVEIVLSNVNGAALTWNNGGDVQASAEPPTVPARTLYHIVPCLLLSDRPLPIGPCGRALSITRPF